MYTATESLFISNFEMKKFIIKLVIFLIPVVGFIALWEYGLGKLQNSYKLKRSQLEAQAPKIEVLVLGGSFSLRGVNPEYFSMKGYNVANVQQSIYYDTRIALKYLDKMPSLKVVLIAVSYNSLWWQTENFRDYFYADYWDIKYPTIKWYDLTRYSKILQYGNGQAINFAFHGFKTNLVAGYSDNGYAYATKQGKYNLINDPDAEEAELRYDKYGKQENLYSNITDIRSLMDELTRRHIHGMFFVPPITGILSKYLEKGKVRTMDSLLSVLSVEYNTQWFNYQDDPRFSDSDFKNISHLNSDGATKFSKIINEEILQKYTALQN